MVREPPEHTQQHFGSLLASLKNLKSLRMNWGRPFYDTDEFSTNLYDEHRTVRLNNVFPTSQDGFSQLWILSLAQVKTTMDDLVTFLTKHKSTLKCLALTTVDILESTGGGIFEELFQNMRDNLSLRELSLAGILFIQPAGQHLIRYIDMEDKQQVSKLQGWVANKSDEPLNKVMPNVQLVHIQDSRSWRSERESDGYIRSCSRRQCAIIAERSSAILLYTSHPNSHY